MKWHHRGVYSATLAPYLGDEQFWGRAVRASRDSLESGALLNLWGIRSLLPGFVRVNTTQAASGMIKRPVRQVSWAAIRMFTPHSNFGDEVNRNILQSEIEGGVFLKDLPPATVLQIDTRHHSYTLVFLGESNALISGHPQYCPDPVPVAIAGSTWGGSMLKLRFVGRGMHLEFHHPEYRTPIITSAIQEIRECMQPLAAHAMAF
jgi:hypothetical protein